MLIIFCPGWFFVRDYIFLRDILSGIKIFFQGSYFFRSGICLCYFLSEIVWKHFFWTYHFFGALTCQLGKKKHSSQLNLNNFGKHSFPKEKDYLLGKTPKPGRTQLQKLKFRKKRNYNLGKAPNPGKTQLQKLKFRKKRNYNFWEGSRPQKNTIPRIKVPEKKEL